MELHLCVNADHYHQVFLTTMVRKTSPEEIRRQLEKKLPANFLDSALNVSDIIAITEEGISTAYYVKASCKIKRRKKFHPGIKTVILRVAAQR